MAVLVLLAVTALHYIGAQAFTVFQQVGNSLH
jgi:NO-binding membrane sensor protein with MHYT domain